MAHERTDAIESIALRLIHERGYHAVSLRDIAAEVELHVSSLYNYYASKDELLATVTLRALTDLQSRVSEAVGRESEPIGRLRALIQADIEFHLEYPEKGSVITTEHRSLVKGSARDRIRDEIKAFERNVMAILEDGVRAGVVHVQDVQMAAYLITTSCARTSVWYKANGRLSKQEIVEAFADLLIRAVHVPQPEAAPGSRSVGTSPGAASL